MAAIDELLRMRVSQADFARLIGVSEARVSQMVADGIIPAGGELGLWLALYCERLREQAAGRGQELTIERAALAKAQRIGQEIKNAVAQGEFAPVGLLGDVLAAASAAVVDRFDGLPGQLRKACPDLPAEAREAIEKTIASARNEWIRSSAELAIARMDDLADTGDEADLFDAEDAPP